MNSAPAWPSTCYDRTALPERVLQFGTGALLRAVVAAAVDAANRAGEFNGRIVAVQSTNSGRARALDAQRGLFVVAERGVERGEAVERTNLLGSISRALTADVEWQSVREVVARPELRVIVSNVTEAGFRLGADDVLTLTDPANAPASFPARLTDLLHVRYKAVPGGPVLFVIPTELVPDNGARLAGMVNIIARQYGDSVAFRAWIARRVRFCSSLVDRITTGAPDAAVRARLESRLGFRDALLTVTEPHSFWAIECDPESLREAFPVDVASRGRVLFAPSIEFYRERKLRLLNGAHTALAPLCLLAGIRLVRDGVTDAAFGEFLRQLLFDEIAPSTGLSAEAGRAYSETVIDRFRNPWLDHEWRVIVQNQVAKLRSRLVPSVVESVRKRRAVPRGLAMAIAGSLRFARATSRLNGGEGWGWWRGDTYPIVDADLELIDRHWRSADPALAPGPVSRNAGCRLVASALGDREIWGHDLTSVAGLPELVTDSLVVLEEQGAKRSLDWVLHHSLRE